MLPQVTTFLYAYLRMIPIYLVLRALWLKYKRKKIVDAFTDSRETLLFLFFLIVITILVFTLDGNLMKYDSPKQILAYAKWRLKTGHGMNLIPFKTIKRYYDYRNVNSQLFYNNIIGNILLFVPFGFGLALLWEQKGSFIKMALVSILLPVLIECVQLFIGRQVDIDDILLNFLGSILGAIIVLLIRKFLKKKTE